MYVAIAGFIFHFALHELSSDANHEICDSLLRFLTRLCRTIGNHQLAF